MSAKTKVAKVRCRCTGGKLIDPCVPPLLPFPMTPIAQAYMAGCEAMSQAVESLERKDIASGKLGRIGMKRYDGAVLVGFVWRYPPKPLKQLIAESPTMGEMMRRDEAEKGGQH